MSRQFASTKFGVEWKEQCYLCNCPMDIRIAPDKMSDLFLSRLSNFMNLYPITLFYNTRIYKFFGITARKVCYGCYLSEPHKKYHNLRNRETGLSRVKFATLSQSRESLYNWFESFNRYLNRPDAEIYVVGQ
jgi:hypothetical protein